MATAMNACVVACKSRKSRAFLTFSQVQVFFPGRKYFEKSAIQGREDSAKHAKSPQNPVLKLYSNTNLTIPKLKQGGLK